MIDYKFIVTSVVTYTGMLATIYIAWRVYRMQITTAERLHLIHKSEIGRMRANLESKLYAINEQLVSTEEKWKDLHHLFLSKTNIDEDGIPKTHKIHHSEFLRQNGVNVEDLIPDPKLVFVLTPFHSKYNDYFAATSAAFDTLGMKCVRGDEKYIPGDILRHILIQIVKAKVVIANLDGRNPNVFYELGICMALDKYVILTSPAPESEAFDVRGNRFIKYSSLNDLQKQIIKRLDWLRD